MSEQKLDEIFTENESIIFNKMQEILDIKTNVLDLKSKIKIYEDHKRELKEYIQFSETIIRKYDKIKMIIPNITKSIEETQQSIINIKKDIAVMESKKDVESNPIGSDKKLVTNMKKVLAALYEDKVDLIIQKEKKLMELKNKNKEYDASQIFKEEQAQLENYKKEYDLWLAKNIHLKEMIAMNIEQQI